MTAWRHAIVDSLDAAAAAAARAVVHTINTSTAPVDLALTGGGAGNLLTERLAASPDVDWSRVRLWYGDERWVPLDDDARNDRVAVLAQSTHPSFAQAQLNRVAGSDTSSTPEEAARAYADALSTSTGNLPGHVPSLDIVVLGVGPDGHVASIFPGHIPSDAAEDRTVIAVHHSPKPPPTRVSFSLATIRATRQVVLLAAGEEKADAVRRILAAETQRDGHAEQRAGNPGGELPKTAIELPAAWAQGRESTLLISTTLS